MQPNMPIGALGILMTILKVNDKHIPGLEFIVLKNLLTIIAETVHNDLFI